MPVYVYCAKQALSHEKVRGEVHLPNETMVYRYLSDKALYPIFVHKKSILDTDVGELFFKKKKLPLKAVNLFVKQFAALLKSGISITNALELCGTHGPKKLQKHLKHMKQGIARGCILSEAVQVEGVFPEIMTYMITSGEVSGNLDGVLENLVNHFEYHLALSKKIKKACIYPAIIVVIMILVLWILMVQVVPEFTLLLEETHTAMPRMTQLVLGVSHFLLDKWKALVGSLGGLSILVIILKNTPKGREIMDYVVLHFPFLGKLYKKYITATFASTLSMLLGAGVPMLQALQTTKLVMKNSVVAKELEESMIYLKKGKSLHEALQENVNFTPILYHMMHIGEEAGNLDEMLIKISCYLKEEVERATEYLTLLIEPILTIVMAILVGSVMLAVIQPTFAIATSIM